MSPSLESAPISFGHLEVMRAGTSNGQVVRANTPLVERFTTLAQMLQRHAAESPARVFLREPIGTDWRELRYGDALQITDRLASSLAARGLSVERPLAILSGNSIDHALLALAAMSVGIPVAPISVAYSQFEDLSRLRSLLKSLTPGLVYAEDGAQFERALRLAADMGYEIAVGSAAHHGVQPVHFETLAEGDPVTDPTALMQSVNADTVAKILFTSGSTGAPKGVIITQRMMCSNQDAMAQVWPFLDDEPPVIVDWLPWNHVFGGCLNFNLVLRNGGTLVIDDGRPLPDRMQRTLENIREHRPTVYMGVPGALKELAKACANDPEFERVFFGRLRAIFSAGAALPRDTWDALHAGCLRATGRKLNLFIGWGATETAPVVSITRPESTRPDSIGLPVPGAAIKLVPSQDKLELRVKGPMVTPGYWRRPDLAGAAFDADGFYAIGDAGRLDEVNWQRDGILFDGRVAENFKLITGTWVSVGPLRLAALAAGAPLFDEVVITGHDRGEVGLLVFPNLAACRALTNRPSASLPELVGDQKVRAKVAEALETLCRNGGGSSTQVRRALLLSSPPSVEAGEMTDKGYLNQRAALQFRDLEARRLYAEPRDPDVILNTNATSACGV
ncbi:MAG TPA: AMP-binding protein [Burkholderiaceae bacterium]|nr:AMP-binding protein [Burkholderiaceae bacterium]